MSTPAERPIIFSAEMVRAILSGRKTQTRRVIKPQPTDAGLVWVESAEGFAAWVDEMLTLDEGRQRRCPYGKPGDRLWVRETWAQISNGPDCVDENGTCPCDGCHFEYKADTGANYPGEWDADMGADPAYPKWRPSIHMFRWASRINLRLKAVRVERVQEITPADTLLEGIDLPIPRNCDASPPPDGYNQWPKAKQEDWIQGMARTVYMCRCADIDDHIQAFRALWDSINAKRGFGWDANPWVWVLAFEREVPDG